MKCLQISKLMHQLQELIATFESSFASSQEQRSAEAEFAPVLNAIIEPAMQMCSQSAALLPNSKSDLRSDTSIVLCAW